jgi:hypothetical protein
MSAAATMTDFGSDSGEDGREELHLLGLVVAPRLPVRE